MAVALKILRNKNRSSETFQRFRDEIELLKALGTHPGIVPVVDASLLLEAKDLPWIAMAVAEPIQEALGETPPLERTVAAAYRVAETLASLTSRGISHRDIKPENLYWFKGDAAIGDFGLADFPDKLAITRNKRWLGPLHFMAPEMLLTPATASGELADVYSLAKTLWVLESGQRWPPPGQHRLDDASSLRTLIDHPHVHELDRLIERSTALIPAEGLLWRNSLRS